MTVKDDIAMLIRARYPVLWLVSWEEARVERILATIAAEQKGKRLVTWTATKGFMENGKVIEETAVDLGVAFNTVAEDAKNGGKTIYVFKDMHRALKDSNANYRLVRDACDALKGSYCTVVILSPVLEYPKELEKIVTVVDIPYPTSEELRAVMDKVLKSAEMPSPANGDAEEILRAAAGLTEEEFENIVARSLIQHKKVVPEVVVREKEQVIRKGGVVEFYQRLDGLENVGGLEVLKEWIVRRSKTFSSKAIAFGVKPPKGIFLGGVTGCGKSLSVKAMASYLKVPLLMVDPSKVYGQYVGQSEQNIRALFKVARAVAPCVLFIDEAEKLLPQGTSGDSGVSSRVFGMLLTEMQECPPETPILFAMTANDPLKLPPELFTRFDAVWFIDLPSQVERIAVWTVQIRKAGRDHKNFDLAHLAEKSEGWTGREMEMIVSEALARAFDTGTELTTEGILAVLGERIPISVQRKTDIENMRRWGKDTAIQASRKAKVEEGVRKLEL